MDSIGKECTELKKKYESCFNSWYTDKYLKGNVRDDCKELFKLYKECLDKVLKEKKVDIMLEEHGKLSTDMFKENEKYPNNSNKNPSSSFSSSP